MIEGIKVIDFHGHVGRWDKWVNNYDQKLMLHAMDSAGIDISCLFNTFYPDGTSGNDRAAEFVAKHPDRFIGYAVVSPEMPERMVPELTRAIDELKFRAIKVYPPYTTCEIYKPPWHPIYEFANERKLAILFHTGVEWQNHTRYLAKIAPDYPEAIFVSGHSGNVADERADAIAGAQAHPNIYLETCSTFRTPGVIEQLVNEAGADRVLYGSDIPVMDPRAQIGKIITAEISDEAKRQVLGGNASRLLGL